MHGRFVLYLHEFRISLGLLLMSGIKVALKISIPCHAFSGFLIIICFTIWTILSTLPTEA